MLLQNSPLTKDFNFRHQFKLERWMDYGPTIAAAFASSNENEVNNLRTIFSELMKRSPQKTSSRLPSGPYVSQETADRYNNPQYGSSGHANSMYFASSASAGMIEGNSVHSGRSARSQYTGHYSTGPVERSTVPVSPGPGFHY